MPRIKALLSFDPARRAEQSAFAAERVELLFLIGSQWWVALTEEQAARLARQGITVQPALDADLIDVPAAIFDPLADPPQPPPALEAPEPLGDEQAIVLVQFHGPTDPSWIGEIETLGAEFLDEQPVNAVAFLLSGAILGAVRELPFVRWAGIHHPAYALDYRLAAREEPFAGSNLVALQVDPARVLGASPGTALSVRHDPEAAGDDSEDIPANERAPDRDPARGLLTIIFFGEPTGEQRDAVVATGATIWADTGYSLIVEALPEHAQELAQIPGVRVVEPQGERRLQNQRAGRIIAVDQVRELDTAGIRTPSFLTNLDGTNEIVGVIDTGLDNGALPPAHPDFVGRLILIGNLNGAAITARDTAPTATSDPHGTHVSGSIVGTGAHSIANLGLPPTNTSRVRGMAPNARLVFHSLRRPTVADPRNLDFSNFMRGFNLAYNAGARVQSNSWGANTNNVYDSDSRNIDRFAYLHPDTVILFAAGNDERDLNGNGVLDQNQLDGEATTKNVIAVGACEDQTNQDGDRRTYRATSSPGFFGHANFTPNDAPAAAVSWSMSNNPDQIALFSSRGRVVMPGLPVAQRRVKPDLVAPGTNVLSTLPVGIAARVSERARTAPATHYRAISGTSMATPITAGAALLTRQFYRTLQSRQRGAVALDRLIDGFVLPAGLEAVAPALAAHADGYVLAWAKPGSVAGKHTIVVARYSAELVAVGAALTLADLDGDQPVVRLARRGDTTLLLCRVGNDLQLRCFDRALAPVAAFGTNGVATVGPARAEANRMPALLVVATTVALAWCASGSDTLSFRRFDAATGAALGAALEIDTVSALAPHGFIHNGAHYALVFLKPDGANTLVRLRLVTSDGTPAGEAQTIDTLSDPTSDPVVAWNTRLAPNQFLVGWVCSPGGVGRLLRRAVGANARPLSPTATVVAPTPNVALRRPLLLPHPVAGWTLIYEQNAQLGQPDPANPDALVPRFDVYLATLDPGGTLDGRTSGGGLRISDAGHDSFGFAAISDARATLIGWKSADEANSDGVTVSALTVGPGGEFGERDDATTPRQRGASYTIGTLARHDAPALFLAAAAFCGGDSYVLRQRPRAPWRVIDLLRLNADGAADLSYGVAGAQYVDIDAGQVYQALALHWSGTHLFVGAATRLSLALFGLDGTGTRLDGRIVGSSAFGAGGQVNILEAPAAEVSLGLAHRAALNPFPLVVAWGVPVVGASPTLRFTRLNADGTAQTGLPRDLVADVAGTARRGWFHMPLGDAPVRATAVWQRSVGGRTIICANRFRVLELGQPIHADVQVTTLPGNSRNAVLAPRPLVFNLTVPLGANAQQRSNRREYGVAWEYQPPDIGGAAQPTQIRFARLNRDATLGAVTDHEVVGGAVAASHPQLIWHRDGYGLAWIERDAGGGDNRLMFTLLDENGQRPVLPNAGRSANAPIGNFQLSAPGGSVQDFQLLWNGRSFLVVWSESRGGELVHQQRAVALPRQFDDSPFTRVYLNPSATLIQATLYNGATNLRDTALPNIGPDPNDGYGWGRVNLRQSLAPMPPATFYARDDGGVGPGCTARYRFYLPPGTALLRATLTWSDPPDRRVVNRLHLRISAPAAAIGARPIYHGNSWAAGAPLNSQAQAAGAAFAPTPLQNAEQIVLQAPPAGYYDVEIVAEAFPFTFLNQLNIQPFALVFVGSGPEIRFRSPGVGPIAGGVY